MVKTDLIKIHEVFLQEDYIPQPERHLNNYRDGYHYEWVLNKLNKNLSKTILDIGSYDGWLDILLAKKGFKVEGIELIRALAKAAEKGAKENHVEYEVHVGFFEDIVLNKKYNAVISFETLEHVYIESVPNYISKMERLCNGFIGISLPDQDCKLNTQHRWTPTEELIKGLFGKKNDFNLEYKEYSNNIPSNWFISYSI